MVIKSLCALPVSVGVQTLMASYRIVLCLNFSCHRKSLLNYFHVVKTDESMFIKEKEKQGTS